MAVLRIYPMNLSEALRQLDSFTGINKRTFISSMKGIFAHQQMLVGSFNPSETYESQLG